MSQAAGALDPSAALNSLLGKDIRAMAEESGAKQSAPLPEDEDTDVHADSSSKQIAPSDNGASSVGGKGSVPDVIHDASSSLHAPSAAPPRLLRRQSSMSRAPKVRSDVRVVLASRRLSTSLARFENRDAAQMLMMVLKALAKRALV
jgi:hypothetical protein